MLLCTPLPWNIFTSITDECSGSYALNFFKIKSLQSLEGFEVTTVECRAFYIFVVVIFPLPFCPQLCLRASTSPIRHQSGLEQRKAKSDIFR